MGVMTNRYYSYRGQPASQPKRQPSRWAARSVGQQQQRALCEISLRLSGYGRDGEIVVVGFPSRDQSTILTASTVSTKTTNMAMAICRRRSNRYKKLALFGLVAACYFILDRFVLEHGPMANREDDFWSDLILNRRQLGNVSYIDANVTCRRPALSLWPPEIRSMFRIHSPPKCDAVDWVYIRNGAFYVNSAIQSKYGGITCRAYPIEFVTDFKSSIGEGVPIQDGQKIKWDFFKVSCQGQKSWSTYVQVLAGVTPKVPPLTSVSPPWPREGFPMNILMVGYDSISRLNWIRNMPSTYRYFVDQLGGVVLEGYNIVGDGTPQALLPILTGRTEDELPEARWGYSNAKEIDGHPWIWHDLRRRGYVAQWAEDYISTGAFQLRLKGFAAQPVEHYYRAFLQVADSYKLWLLNSRNCLGSRTRNARILDWSRELFAVYPRTPKFSFLFQGELSHNDLDDLQVADDEVKDFLSTMEREGYLENTLLILMSDHGLRAGSFRKTQQGKYEERLPFFAVRLPDWFRRAYPEESRHLATNAFRLTTPFDVHATFRHLIDFRPGEQPDRLTRGMSLLREVPAERTCSDGAIPSHWCTCLDSVELSPSENTVIMAAKTLVNAINEILNVSTDRCAPLSLGRILEAARLTPQKSVLKFRYSKDHDGRIPDLSGYDKTSEVYYQVTLETLPGGARFEATIRLHGVQFKVDFKSVSRINIYGNQSRCITTEFPHLRPYCYCK
ncbi:hypothetical protein LSH36_137g00020 [Paralvinella palmiformis]|uniref:DUF229 domain containing protein n=1 Tax=Paralvinella palmiformis TaxID=53620 RepID=A0AAD9JWZ7_9ANNE|nr:hypothetical protein LSH36_137g00020 [Paralvinella palmiformis]